jgi:ABC-type nitrate/sulfonate/bicarbonate transport system permease component
MIHPWHPALRPWVVSVLSVMAALAIWELIGRARALGEVWPPLSTVLRATVIDPSGRQVLLHGAIATVEEAATGLVAGMLLGSLLALAAHMIPVLARGLGQLAVLVQAVPVIAITPFLLTTIDRGAIPSTLAAIGPLFAAFVSVTAGLSSSSVLHRELFRVFGATRFARLRHLDVPACLPYLLEGLRFAVPGAMVGAIVGEWFEAAGGLGVVMVQTMRSGDMQMLLGAALVASLISLAAYGAAGVVERYFRWDPS